MVAMFAAVIAIILLGASFCVASEPDVGLLEWVSLPNSEALSFRPLSEGSENVALENEPNTVITSLDSSSFFYPAASAPGAKPHVEWAHDARVHGSILVSLARQDGKKLGHSSSGSLLALRMHLPPSWEIFPGSDGLNDNSTVSCAVHLANSPTQYWPFDTAAFNTAEIVDVTSYAGSLIPGASPGTTVGSTIDISFSNSPEVLVASRITVLCYGLQGRPSTSLSVTDPSLSSSVQLSLQMEANVIPFSKLPFVADPATFARVPAFISIDVTASSSSDKNWDPDRIIPAELRSNLREVIPASIDPEAPSTLFQPTQKLAPLLLLTSSISFSDVRDSFAPGVLGSRFSLLPVGEWRCSFEGGTRLVPCSRGCGQRSSRQCRSLVRPHPVSNVEFDQGDETTISLTLDSCAFASVSQPAPARCAASISSASVSATVQNGLVIDYRSNDFFGMGLTAHVRGFLDSFAVDDLRACSLDAAGIEPACKRGKHLELFLPPDQVLFKGRFIFRHSPKSWAQNVNVTVTFSTTASSEAAAFKVSSFIDVNVSPLPAPLKRRIDFVPDYASSDEANRLTGSLSFQIFGGAIPPQMLSISDINAAPEAVRVCLPPGATFVDQSSTQAHVAKSVLFAGLDDTFFLPAQEDTFLAANVTAAPDMLQDSGLILTCVDVTLPGDATLDNGSPANGVAVTIHGVRVDVDPSSVSDVAIPFFFTAGGMVAAVSVQARLVFSFEGYHSTFTGYNLLIVLRGAVPSVVDQERVVSQLRPDAKGETHVIGETVAIERRDATTITIAFPVPKALSWALPLFARPSPNPSPFYDSQVVLKEQGSDELIASFSALETDWYPSGIWLCSSSQSPELDVCGDDPVPTCPAPQVNVFCGTGAGMSLAPTPLVCAFAPKAKQQGDLCGERFAFASLDHFSSASFALSIVINPEMSPIFSTAADANYILQIEIPSALRLLVHDNDQCSASMNSGGDLPCTIVAQAAISLVSVLLTPALLPNGNVLALNSTISLSLESLSYDEWVELSVGIVGSAPSAGEAGKPRSVLLSSPRLPLGAVNYVSSPEQSLGRADVVMSVSLGSFGGPDSVSFTATAVANQTSSGSGFNVPADEHGDSFVYDQLGVLVSTQFVLASKKADRALSCSISYTDNAAFDDIGFSSPNPVWPFVEQSTTFFGNDISQVVLRGSLSLLHMNLSTSMQLNEISMLAVSCRGIPAVYSPSSSPSSDRIALLFIDSARQQAFRQNVGRLPWIPTSDSAPRARARDRLPLASSSIVLVPFVSDGADYPDHILKSATETLSTAIGSSLPGADAIFIVKSSGQQQTLSAFSTAFRFPPEFAGIASIIAFGHKLSASLVAAVRSALTDAGFLAASSITPAFRAPYYAPREGGWMCFSDPLRTRLEPCLPSSPCDPAFQGEMVCAFPIAPAGSFRHVPNELPNTECSFAEPPSPPNISDTTCSSALSSIDAVFTLTGNGNITNGTEAQGTLFVSFTLNDTLSSALDFALHFSDTDYIFDFVSADCTNLEVGLTMMNSSHIECSVPPQGGITVKLFGVTESGSFEIASVLLNSWSRSAILGITVNRLEDDSTLYFGDPEIKVGPVGVSVFAAAHTVSHFLPTKAESSRLSGEFLVGIDNDELQLVDFMPMELHILPPPDFTVEQCRVAFRLSSSPVAWPLLLPFSSSIYPTRLPSDDRVVSLSFSHSNGTLLEEEGETLKGNSSGNLNITALWIVCEANVPKQYYVASKESLQTSFSVASQTMIADIIDPVKVSVLGGDVDLMTVPQPLEGFASFQIYAPRVPVRLADRIEKALHVNTRVTDLTNDTYQVNFELPSSQIVLAPAILLPALLMPALQNIPNERALTDASLIPLSQQWGYTGRWMCGSGPFENCYVPNNCGISFQKPLVCSVPLLSSLHSGGTWEPPSDGFRNYDGGNLGSVVSNLGENGIQYVTDPSLAACTFQNRPAEIISSGCGQYYCRNPHGARVPCTSAEVCFKGCSSKSQTIGAGDLEDPVFKPFCSLPDQPNSDVDPAAFCPQELVDPARYNRACIPRSECMYVCGNKSGFAVSCDSDESWKQCSVSCGNGVQERIKICTVPPAPALGSRVTSLTDTMCSFSRFSDSTVRPCGGSQCSDYQWYCSSDNGASYAPCDANGHLSGPWGPCSTDCGTGSRTRRVACAAIDSKGMVTDVGLPDSLCTPRSGKPASTSTCSVNVCANAKWMCYPDGGDPTKPVSCDSLGGFNCPTSGCGVTVRNRSIGCYSGTASIPTSICRSLTPPPTQTQCPAVTNSCTVSYRNSMCIYNATGERDASLEAPCVPASGPEPDIYMRGTCINLVGEKVSDSWCGSVEDILERCYLPPCSDDLRFEWRTEPGECRNVADMCATYRLVAVTCHATSPGIANITVSSALCDPTTRPPSAEACFPETDGIPTCANNGTCLNEPVRIDGVLYPLVVTGTCVCVPGTGGPLCEEKLAVSNLAVSFRGSTDWRFRWSVSSTVIAAPAVVSVRSPSLPDDVVIGIVDSRKQELLVPITTLSLLLSPGSYTLHVSVPFGETSTMLDLTPLCLRPGLSCLNNGLCNQSSGTCTCRGEYTGPTCASTPCDMKGCNPAASTCAINSGGVARCECATSPLTGHALFKGDRCQTPVGGCDPSLEKCLNGGERTGYISPSGVGVCGACSCPNFFSGELCERCTLDDSCVNGIPDSFCQSCQCKAGFMGPTCTCRFATLTFLLSAAEESDLHWYAEAATDSQTVLKTSPYYPTVLRWMSGIDSALSFVINDPDVSSSVFEHRLLRGSSGDLYVQVVARISGACGANLGAVLSFSLLDVEPEMYRVYAALARLLSALDSPDLSSSIPPLGAFVKNAGIGFNDPNCVRSERCPKNVGDGGTIHNVPGPVDPATREPPRSGLSRDETIALSVVLSFAFVAVLSGLFYTWYSRSCCFANRSEFDDFVEEDPRDTYGSV